MLRIYLLPKEVLVNHKFLFRLCRQDASQDIRPCRDPEEPFLFVQEVIEEGDRGDLAEESDIGQGRGHDIKGQLAILPLERMVQAQEIIVGEPALGGRQS